MRKDEFMTLTGEHPVDVFGADWENILEEMSSEYARELGQRIHDVEE